MTEDEKHVLRQLEQRGTIDASDFGKQPERCKRALDGLVRRGLAKKGTAAMTPPGEPPFWHATKAGRAWVEAEEQS